MATVIYTLYQVIVSFNYNKMHFVFCMMSLISTNAFRGDDLESEKLLQYMEFETTDLTP